PAGFTYSTPAYKNGISNASSNDVFGSVVPGDIVVIEFINLSNSAIPTTNFPAPNATQPAWNIAQVDNTASGYASMTVWGVVTGASSNLTTGAFSNVAVNRYNVVVISGAIGIGAVLAQYIDGPNGTDSAPAVTM